MSGRAQSPQAPTEPTDAVTRPLGPDRFIATDSEPSLATALDTLMRWRRDVRRFRREPVPVGLLEEVVAAVRLAPSVGLSEPTRLVLVEDDDRRRAVVADFRRCNEAALTGYAGDRARLYASLKLEGLTDAPIHLAVFADGATTKGHGLGCRTMPETRAYSAVCAIAFMWLAAQARGLGLGWVSIIDPVRVVRILEVPESWHLVGYLCLGWPLEQSDVPELARAGWEQRDPHGPHIERR